MRNPRQSVQGGTFTRILSILALLVLVAAAALRFARQEASSPSDHARPAPAAVLSEPAKTVPVAEPPAPSNQPVAAPVLPPAPPRIPSEKEQEAGQTLRSLVGWVERERLTTPEQGRMLLGQIQQLVSAGAASIPAIGDFLKDLKDVPFASKLVADQVGSPTLRTALLNALQAIGGPEGLEAQRTVLASSADPAEIALIARHLETSAPGQYRQEFTRAASEAIQMAARGELTGSDVAPLFGVLGVYADPATALSALHDVRQWPYYKALTLARLPDGVGIQDLLADARDPNAQRKVESGFHWQMLAQAAATSEEARNALLNEARAESIPETAWRKIAIGLAGEQYNFAGADSSVPPQVAGAKIYHIAAGNQNFFSIPLNTPPEELQQRQAFLDSLRGSISNPVALASLNAAAAMLNAAKK